MLIYLYRRPRERILQKLTPFTGESLLGVERTGALGPGAAASPLAASQLTRILRSMSVTLSADSSTEAMLAKSLSEVIGAHWTRNLSRHLASRGGSCFIACRRTSFHLWRQFAPHDEAAVSACSYL
jgi:hypothetical protein